MNVQNSAVKINHVPIAHAPHGVDHKRRTTWK